MLIVETGAVIAGANCYISLVDARAKAVELGVTLPTLDVDADAAIINGTQYVDYKQYSGSRVSIDQTLDWPRTGASANGFTIPDTTIPLAVINASVLAAATSATLFVNDNGKQVEENTVHGAVTQKFFENTSANKGEMKVTRADALLKPYLLNGGYFNNLMGVV